MNHTKFMDKSKQAPNPGIKNGLNQDLVRIKDKNETKARLNSHNSKQVFNFIFC